jgi:hypothetical protein
MFIIIGLGTTRSYGQKKSLKPEYYQQQANRFASVQQYKKAASAFLLESKGHKMMPYKKNATGNAAYCYALANMPDSALACLVTSTRKYGFRNLDWLTTAPILNEVRKLKGYSKLKQELIQLNTQNNPDKARIVTSDINLFWKVYDQYRKDTANAENLFLTGYFDKGSLGLQEYYRLKTPNIGGIKGFVRNIKTMPRFYNSIRKNSLQIQSLADTVKNIYRKLKYWYPESNFPNTTFVIGGWSSGGTATEYGSLVGADMQTADSLTITEELSTRKKNNLIPFTGIKYVVAHELIHVQQSEMANDTTLLNFAIREGMADFIGEIISGKTANERLKLWAKGKERHIWIDFKKEMYLNRYANWIGNSEQETPDHPADLG